MDQWMYGIHGRDGTVAMTAHLHCCPSDCHIVIINKRSDTQHVLPHRALASTAYLLVWVHMCIHGRIRSARAYLFEGAPSHKLMFVRQQRSQIVDEVEKTPDLNNRVRRHVCGHLC